MLLCLQSRELPAKMNDQLTENVLAVCPASHSFHYDESVEAGNEANKIQGS